MKLIVYSTKKIQKEKAATRHIGREMMQLQESEVSYQGKTCGVINFLILEGVLFIQQKYCYRNEKHREKRKKVQFTNDFKYTILILMVILCPFLCQRILCKYLLVHACLIFTKDIYFKDGFFLETPHHTLLNKGRFEPFDEDKDHKSLHSFLVLLPPNILGTTEGGRCWQSTMISKSLLYFQDDLIAYLCFFMQSLYGSSLSLYI